MRWAVSQVARHKLVIGLTAQSVREHGGTFERISESQALADLGTMRLDTADGTANVRPGGEIRARLDGLDALTGEDAQIQTPFIDYFSAEGTLSARVWLTTRRALRFRLAQLQAFGVGGVAFYDLLGGELADGLLDEILDYRIQEPPPQLTTEGLQLRWRIVSGGVVVDEIVTGFNDEIVLTLDAPEGQYDVSVAVVDGERVRREDSVAVALAMPSMTPTPLPQSTDRPAPTLTPTLIPVIPTLAPPEPQPPLPGEPATGGAVGSTPLAMFNAPPPPPVGSGSINMSGFEYGGHVTNMSSSRAVNAMRDAGMTWIKVQIRFAPGTGIENAASQIEAGRRNGFKTLVGIVGSPRDVSAGGEGYIRQYAEFAAAVARLGPDAIEVWNEPNIGREWPSGQISGANYTALLAQTYNAIKAANSNVMVISGAPAPTGAQDAFPGEVVNDDVFLTQMVNAGALNYMDCVGMHYNEGVVVRHRPKRRPPRQLLYALFADHH